ncbi:hypothetical protein FRC00_003796 [Tulasnella sp. 408]|nr:hypothetical protein FRC00_003796 [Tulasnella sp. 408]
MQFISRLLLSWALFFFLLVQAVQDDSVVAVLLPVLWLPAILFVAALTYLVYDTIPSRISPNLSPKATILGRVNLPETIAPVAPAVQITPASPSVDVIDRAQVPTWHGFIVPLSQIDAREVPKPLQKASVPQRVSGTFPSAIVPTLQRANVFCPTHSPYSRPSNDSESGTTFTTLNQTGPDHASAFALPPPVLNESPKSPQTHPNIDELLPLLEWNFTASSAFQDEADEDMFDEEEEEEQWWDTEDDQPIQVKEVARSVVPFPSHVDDDFEEGEGAVVSSTSTWAPTSGLSSRPLIPTGRLNPNIESLQLRPNQESIQFPLCDDDDDEDIAPPSTPAPTGAHRARLRVPAQKPDASVQLHLHGAAQGAIQVRSYKDKDEDGEDRIIRERHSSVTRPRAPSRPVLPIPIGRHNTRIELTQGITPLPTWVEEEEEEEEEDSSTQDRHPSSTSNTKPNRDASTSTTSTAVEAPIDSSTPNACGKPSAMKKLGAPSKMATVSWLHSVETRDLPVTICDRKARSRFVSEEEEKELDEEYLTQKNIAALGDEEAEETDCAPFERGELSCQQSLLSWNAEPQENMASKRVERGGQLRKVFAKVSPIRVGKRLFKKRTGPL